ncbi:MAG: hypothetical protein MRQ07_05425 [Candidatus Midichloria sp.]|nr:hypothetical protein [Candidatus Midichloria sp.]
MAIAKISTFIIAILAICLSLLTKGIIELCCGNFWSTVITVPLTAGFLKFRTNYKAFIASVMLAITFTYISGYIV